MREYQVSYRGNRLVTKDNIIDVLNELGYRPGGEEGGLRLLTITSWYLKTDQSSGITVQHPENPTLDNPAPPKPGWHLGFILPDSTYRYVWKFSDYHYGDPDHEEIEGFHVYTDCELVSIYSSPDTSMGIDFIYTLFDDTVQSVTLLDGTGDYPVTEETPLVPWTRELDTLPYGQKKYLWMSQRRIEDGDHTNWCIPIRLSGEDGSPGADGRNIEFVYKQMNRLPDLETYPSDQPYSAGTHDQEIPNGWHNHPSGVGYFTETEDGEEIEVFYRYEWASYRLRINDPPDSIKWNAWSPPIVWSAYGEKGMDGDGVEYVYMRNETYAANPPASPSFEYGNSGQTTEWRGGVYLEGDNPNNPNNWRPKDWPGTGFVGWIGGKYGPQGEWLPMLDVNSDPDDNRNYWTDDPKGVSDTYKKEWVSQRKYVNGSWGTFSPPKVWSTFSKEHTVEIGEDGYWYIDNEKTKWKAEGEDGKGIDLKGRVCFYEIQDKEEYLEDHDELTQEEIDELTTLQEVEETLGLTEDNVGDCYVIEKGRGGRYAGHVFLFLGPDDETTWDKHWYDFGEFQGDGSYVHIAWATYIGTNEITGQLEQRGFAVNRLPNVEYNWMGICTNHEVADPQEDEFTKYKWNYIHGKDGDNFERVYIRTTRNDIVPSISYDSYQEERDGVVKTITKEDDEYRPFVSNGEACGAENSGSSSNKIYQFTDDPKGTELNYPYEWLAERKRKDGEWKNFNTPSIHSNFSHDGQSIIRSTVFKRCESCPETRPVGGDYGDPRPTDTTWSDGLPTTGNGPIWMSSKIFTSDGQAPQDGQYWSYPILLQDTDNLDIELSTQSKNATPLYAPIKYEEATVEHPCNSHVPAVGEDGYDQNKPSGAIGEQIWFDPKLDATAISANANNINWMATRTSFIDPSTGLPEWRDWVIVLIKGEAGAPGKEFQHAYLVYPTASGAPTIDNNTINTNINTPPTTNGVSWTLNTTAGLEVGADESLWMTERTVSDDVPGSWGSPVRISGNGTPGEDAEDIQFVYKRSSTLPSNPDGADKPSLPEAVHQTESPITWYGNVEKVGSNWIPIDWDSDTNGEWSNGWSWNSNAGAWNDEGEWIPNGWTDSPQGVDETPANKYEWMCQRIKPRTNNPDHTDWGDWSNVFVWSAYGDTGMDGDGVEYIYTRNNSSALSAPSGPVAKTASHSGGITWKGGIEKNSDNRWIPKNLPTSEGQFQGWLNGDYNPQGEWIPEGSYDEQGNFIEGNWKDEPQGVNENHLDEWVSQRKRINGEWEGFSIPTRWSNYSIIPNIHIGDDGYWYIGDTLLTDSNGKPISAEGPQGQGIELKGSVDVIRNSEKHDFAVEHDIDETEVTLVSLQEVNPHLNSKYNDIAPGDCYVVRANRYLYVCTHSKGNWVRSNESAEDDSWQWSTNWAEVGEFQGEPGQNSHMHIAWAASKDTDPVEIEGHDYKVRGNNLNFDPDDGSIILIKKFLTNYEDKNPDIDYDWMGIYTDYDVDDPKSDFDLSLDNDDPYEDSSNYQAYAIAHPTEFNWHKYKWNNVRGRDGDNYERVYLKTRSETTRPDFVTDNNDGVTYPDWTHPNPSNPSENITTTFQDQEYLPAVKDYNPSLASDNPLQPYSHPRFTDDPTGVSADWPVEWMAERRKKLNQTTRQVEWFPFSPPAIWAKYSFDGDDGESTKVRYTIALISSGLTISNPTGDEPSSTYSFGGSNYSPTWKTTTTGLSVDSTHFLWMTQRRYKGSEALENWGAPVRLSGIDGDPGKDGADIEFVYLKNNDATTPSKPSDPKAVKSGKQPVNYYGDVDKTTKAPLLWDSGAHEAWSSGWSWDPNAGVWNDEGEWIPKGWTDSPQGVDGSNKYEWACQRTKSSGIDQLWSSWVGPFKWSAYGDTGMDGDGVEYVFFRSPSAPNTPIGPRAVKTGEEPIPWYGGVENIGDSVHPNWVPKGWTYGDFGGEGNWNWDSTAGYYNDSNGEWIPRATGNNISGYWTDDPTGVTKVEGQRLEWVSTRRRVNGQWDNFGDPKLWASFGSHVTIVDGYWWIDGVQYGKAEGEDGKGIKLMGSVDFLTYAEKHTYQLDNPDGLSNEELAKITSLQEIRPGNAVYPKLEIGDCYVVRHNRYLYTSKQRYGHTDGTTNDWTTPTGESGTSDQWWTKEDSTAGPGQTHWAEVGEFQGADGESNYMHIAWAQAVDVDIDPSTGNVAMVRDYITDYENLIPSIEYEWMGIGTDENEDDPRNNYQTGNWDDDDPLTQNWRKYTWNHVKGRDGSDYEKVYIRTTQESIKPTLDYYSVDPIDGTITYDTYTTGNGTDTVIHKYQDTDYLPAIGNKAASGAELSRCTDDPKGVSAEYPYEWIFERRKALNATTQEMEWKLFTTAALWAKYSFDGMSVNLTRLGDSIDIDAAGNPVGGFSSSRLYTEVKAYDPKLNNGDGTFGGYLTYEHTTVANTLPTAAGKFTVDISSKSNCNATKTTAGRAYVSSITNTASNNCSFSLTIHVYGGRKFYFNFPVTIHHIPQTYLTYTLTNDSDTFTYRTRNGQYDGLPLSTTLDVLTTDGVVDKLNDNTTKSNGYISSVTVTGVGADNFLRYAKESGYNNDVFNDEDQVVVDNKTITVTPTDNGSLGTITHNTKTITIYKNSGPSTDTGLRLVVRSNGTVELKRAGLSSDVDLADTSHDLNISCTAVLGGVTYNSLTKTFGLSERNDATLYKLVLSCDSFIKGENGNYSPDTATFSVKVNVTDGTGTTTVTPGEGGIIRGDVKVRYIDGPSLGIGNDSLGVFPTTINNSFFNSIQNKVFTVVVVEFNGETPIAYHDAETVDIVPPGVSQVWMDYTPDRFVVDCDANGIISSTTTDTVRTLNISAYLRWGNLVCTDFDTNNTKITLQNIGSGNYVISTAINRNTTTGEVSIGYRFSSGKALTSGQAKIRIKGTFSNGITKDLTKYVTIEANRTGGPGPKGDFKSTAFIRTNTNIANWRPTGGTYDSPVPEGFEDQSTPTGGWGWDDGIPSGTDKLWSSTAIFYGNGASHTWSYPEVMLDTETYDVEFALRQPDGGTPATPDEHNRHKDGVASGYDYSATGGDKQIWFDPKDDATYISNNYNKFYWKAERELKSGIPQGSWVITQIKGEGAPEVRSDKTTVIIGTDPSGKIISSQTITLTTRLVVDNTIQGLVSNDCNIKYITFDSTVTNPTSNNYELTITPSSINTTSNDCYIVWSIPVPAGIVLRNSDLKITLGNAAYTAYKSVPVIFENRNQSQFTSYIFKRSNTTPTKPSVGNYSEPGPNDLGSTLDWTGWSDGLVSGSYNLYMSSRIFTSDGQAPQQTAWTNPTKLTLTDSPTKGLRFSLADAFPGKPGDTGKYWYNLGGSYSLPGGKTIENMIWMATGTRANSSSSWSWNVVRIKGETAEAGRSIDSIWYKAFNTLDVTIPSITLTIEDLYAQGWNEGYIQPTRDNQYLWKFIRTAYINPDSIDHKGLDLVQVWSENMINPNLLDDTEFFDDDHINAWYLRKGKEWYSTGVQEKTDYLRAGTSHFYSGLPYKEYYVKHKLNDESDTSGTISFLAQYIYNTGSDIRKITSNTWYTLSFLTYGQQTSNGVPVTKLTCDLSHITLASGTDIIWTERVGSGQLTTSTGESKVITFSSKNHWHTVTATFKIGDLPSSATGDNAERIEFKLSYLQTYEQYIWITRPKLEIGQVATEYIPGSGVRDPYPRMTVWGTGKQYYQGIWGEPYLDVVNYGGNWFRCRQTHISSNSNKPAIRQTTTYWEPASDFSFVATNLLLAETAVIDNLIATSLRTGERGVIPHVEMSGSRIEFYGTGMNPSIRFNVDASGTGILEFLDNDGNVLYNLGPNGITRLVDAMNSTYANSALYKITSSTYVGDLITMSGNAVNPGITGGNFNITDKYTLTEGYQKIGGITKYRISNDSSPSAFNGRMFDGETPGDGILQQYLTNNNVEDYSTLFSDEVNWYITINYGPILSFSEINDNDAVYTMRFHQYSKGRLSKTVTIYFTETEVKNAASNLRLLYGHRIVNDVVKSNLKVLPLLNL